MKKVILSCAIGIFLLFLSNSSALAEMLESDSFVIQFGNFNTTSGQKSSASYSVTDTVGQVGSGPYGQYGGSSYFVGSGFQYIYQIDSFRFQLSKILVDLGELLPGSHNTDSHTLTITTRGAGGYSVYAYQLHALRHQNQSDDVPNTTCDAADCTYLVATTWSNQDIPGFGYNMSGHDVPVGFTTSSYFKSFADLELAQDMQIVMSSTNIASQRQSTVTYKAGVSGSQAAGEYETGVVFVAVPGY